MQARLSQFKRDNTQIHNKLCFRNKTRNTHTQCFTDIDQLPFIIGRLHVRTAIKQRNDSVEQFEKAGRQDLADNEKAEISILTKYLPASLSEEEITKLIDEAINDSGATSRKEMGQVMKILQDKAAGRVDNKTLSAAVMQRLA